MADTFLGKLMAVDFGEKPGFVLCTAIEVSADGTERKIDVRHVSAGVRIADHLADHRPNPADPYADVVLALRLKIWSDEEFCRWCAVRDLYFLEWLNMTGEP